MNCPYCGQPATLTGLPNHIDPKAHFRCYCRGEVHFSSSSPEALARAGEARAASRANAAAIRDASDPEVKP